MEGIEKLILHFSYYYLSFLFKQKEIWYIQSYPLLTTKFFLKMTHSIGKKNLVLVFIIWKITEKGFFLRETIAVILENGPQKGSSHPFIVRIHHMYRISLHFPPTFMELIWCKLLCIGESIANIISALCTTMSKRMNFFHLVLDIKMNTKHFSNSSTLQPIISNR